MPVPVPPALSSYAVAADNEAQADLLRRSQLEQANNIEAQLIQCQTLQTAQLESAGRQEFFLHGCFFSLAMLSGLYSWRLIVLAKNQRSFW